MSLPAEPSSLNPAPLWRRFLAFGADGLILGVPLYVLGLLAFDWAAHLGTWGVLIGLAVELAYFTVGDSALMRGRTIGKRLLKIKVESAGGQFLPPPRALLRTAVLCAPLALNGVYAGTNFMIYAVVSLAFFGITLSNLYLLIANRRTRQGLHDLVSGSLVRRAAEETAPAPPPVWKGHFVVVGCICLLALAAPIFALSAFRAQLADVVTLRAAALRQPDVSQAAVQILHRITSAGPQAAPADFVAVQARLSRRPDDLAAAAKGLAETLLRAEPRIIGNRALIVTVSYGFDFGIANSHRSYRYQTSLADQPAPAPP